MHPLLSGAPRVVNIGLAGFARDLAVNGVRVVQVDWRPPSRHAELLSWLESRAAEIERANAEAVARLLDGEPHPPSARAQPPRGAAPSRCRPLGRAYSRARRRAPCPAPRAADRLGAD